MKKTIITFLIVLVASLFQAYGQKGRLLFREDFGGNGNEPVIATTGFPDLTDYTFVKNLSPANGEYLLAKSTKGAGYPAWWGNGTTTPFDDHTYPGDLTKGYMMVVNAEARKGLFFEYTIKDLCPNTRLTFTIYVGNLVRSGQSNVNPSLSLELFDEDGVLLKTYDTGDVPKTTAPDWKEYSFAFENTDSKDITLKIYNSKANGNGNDLVLDDIEIWLDVPELTISSPVPNSYCQDAKMNLRVNFDDIKVKETFENNEKIQWLYSEDPDADIADWEQLPEGNGLTYTQQAKAGFYRVVVGPSAKITAKDYSCCSATEPMEVTLNSDVTTLYWKRDAVDQNWNNPKNWELADGTAVDYAPSACTDVHIPGNSAIFPSLEAAVSGASCVCNDIWFHFGGLIGKPHLLTYHFAYVQYNFGVSDGTNGDSDYSAAPMNRGQWYALAAPLQKMASGDFGLGGFPKMWQQSFKTSPQTKGEPAGAEWYTPENSNAWDIGKQFNAIAIWAGEYGATEDYGEGPDYQTGMDGLNGIFEMPYFENDDIIPFRRGFSHSGGVSSFEYFYGDQPALPLAGISDDLARGDESYRFIFEGDPFTKVADGEYTMEVTSDDIIMIGNPFMSILDFNKFAAENSNIGSYRLYVDNNFEQYDAVAGSPGNMQYIAPLQAFFIEAVDTELKFNAENALADPRSTILRSSSNDNTKADVLYLKAESKEGKSWLTLSMQNVDKENLILLMPQGYPGVPQLYATDYAGQKNSIQFEGGYVNQVPLGILSNNRDQVTITIYNKEKLNVKSLELWDKYLDKKIDLLSNDSYTFQNVPDFSDRFLLMMVSKSVTGISSAESNHPANVSVFGNTLFVNAASGIENVSVVTLQGITAAKDSNIGQTTYSKALQLPSGLYLVSVKLKTGETSVTKIAIK